MAYNQEYERPGHDRINYHELENSRIGSRGILIALGVIGLAIIAMFAFGDVTSTTAPLSAGQTAPIAPAPSQ